MMKCILVILAILVAVCGYSVTSVGECIKQRVYFGLPHDKTKAVIADYEKRLTEDPSDHNIELALGILYAAMGSTLDGPEKSAIQPIIDHTDRFLAAESNNIYAMSYNALGHGLRAKYSLNPFEQISEVNISIKRIEESMALARNTSGELFVRLVRGSIYASLPEFFNKWNTALEDFQRLESAYETNKDLSGEMVLVYYYSGELNYYKHKTAKAREYWQKVVDINRDLKMEFAEARLSQKRLDETMSLR